MCAAASCSNLAVQLMKQKKAAAVLYHYPCPDGAFAALAAHIYFSATSTPALFFPNTVYSPISAEQLPLSEIEDIYLLDFVGSPGFVQQISPRVHRVVVLDHHKTACEMLGPKTSSIIGENVFLVIDMERSGATVAYDFFKDKLLRNADVSDSCKFALREFERVKPLIDYVEDGDLWKWRLENSKAFSSGLKDLNIEYNIRSNPNLFQQLCALELESVINEGMLSLSNKQKLINEVLEQSYKLALGGGAFGHCLAVNADSVFELRSDLGHQLANKSRQMNLRGIGAVAYKVSELETDSILKISLRSVDGEDTTPISQAFGGGGHQNASSFMLSTTDFERWKRSAWTLT
ncbi:uncharacterized protein LOC127791186 isoform X2 [Diospyros lotus]|uniref:uncharacterized protein LOC127791186 isoform X2 n=1 Tax=Diospyros lotus TaxID=55363 RepID=UPI0022517145|nr:uncharacterized protein LOC127791186 isoform X2 [Diospyros lotus]